VVFELPVAHLQKTGWFYDQAPIARRFTIRAWCTVSMCSATPARGRSGPCARARAKSLAWMPWRARSLTVARTAAGFGASVECLPGDAFDVLDGLHAAGRRSRWIVVDPPAIHQAQERSAERGGAYRRINQLAMQLLAPDGILVVVLLLVPHERRCVAERCSGRDAMSVVSFRSSRRRTRA